MIDHMEGDWRCWFKINSTIHGSQK
jgi:hypothetical protein